MRKHGIFWAAATLLGMSFGAQAGIIDFEADSTGAKPNGFASVGHPDVVFSDTSGANLQLSDWGHQSDGQGLAVFSDDPSRLQMDFGVAMSSLSVDFGNDDACCSADGDRAWLEIWNGGALVDAVFVTMNRDDIMNQTISYSGSAFDRAFFYYGNVAGAPINLIEIVDNIVYEAATVPVPAPLALLGMGLLGLILQRRMR